MTKKTICLDFDGVIHGYFRAHDGTECIPNLPVLGTKEAIETLRKDFRVVIHSARAGHGLFHWLEMHSWLKKHGIKVDKVAILKPIASFYIDDKAIQFKGHWGNLLKDISAYTHWHKGAKQPPAPKIESVEGEGTADT